MDPSTNEMIESLRTKYTCPGNYNFSAAPQTAEEPSPAQLAALQRPDQLRPCTRCNGTGTIAIVQNFIRSDRDCPDCDGEGIIRQAAGAASPMTAAPAPAHE